MKQNVECIGCHGLHWLDVAGGWLPCPACNGGASGPTRYPDRPGWGGLLGKAPDPAPGPCPTCGHTPWDPSAWGRRDT